jgi:putative PIN family toxin of toxin-antitoxin system
VSNAGPPATHRRLVPSPLVVLDTMVIMSALMGDPNASSYRLCTALATGEIRLAISDDFLSELYRVVGYPEVESKIVRSARAFRIALDVGYMGIMHRVRRLDWPSIRDQNDGWMLDLAWAARADCIVTRDPHLTAADLPFPVEVLEPHQLLPRLRV